MKGHWGIHNSDAGCSVKVEGRFVIEACGVFIDVGKCCIALCFPNLLGSVLGSEGTRRV